MSKRPRSETSGSVQPSSRPRVEENETSFTLFGAGVLEEVERSVFDGQLSDTSSVSDEPFLACGSSDTSDEDEQSVSVSDNVGDWTGTRWPKDQYRIPRADEDLSGPRSDGFGFTQVTLDQNQKRVTKAFCSYLVSHWPSKQLNSEAVVERHTALVDATAFWTMLLQKQLPSFIEHSQKQPVGNQSTNVRPFVSPVLLK